MSMSKKSDPKFMMAYDRAMLRSAFVSLFWRIITDQKTRGLTLVALAKRLGANKAEVSRWFKGDPNWTINTVASIANALDVDIRIEAVDRKTGYVYKPNGVRYEAPTISSGTTILKPTVKVTKIALGAGREVPEFISARAA